MKLSVVIIAVVVTASVLPLAGCQKEQKVGGEKKATSQHEGHDHEGHTHDSHEGHDHSSHEGHDHDSHEGHDHESHEGHNH